MTYHNLHQLSHPSFMARAKFLLACNWYKETIRRSSIISLYTTSLPVLNTPGMKQNERDYLHYNLKHDQ